jgi:uncharacterized protein involved in exopolysaccharide biosynthesis
MTEAVAQARSDGGMAEPARPMLTPLEMLRELWRHRWRALAATAAGAIVGAILTFVLDPVYEAKTVVSPVTQENMGNLMSGLRSQLGGLAALAGVDLSSLASEAKVTAYATLASDEFIRDYIQANNLLPVLFAKDWDPRRNDWRSASRTRTINEGVKYFRKKIRVVTEDRRTGLVTLQIHWKDPALAANWANGMIERVNARLRREAIRQADDTIVLLSKEIARTDSIDLRQLLYRLMQTNINARTVAMVKREYAFKVIDRAFAPDDDQMIRPRLPQMMILGAVLGLLLSAGYFILARAMR